MLSHLSRKNAKRRRQGNAELGLLDQGEQVLGALAKICLALGQAGHRDQRRPGFLQDPRGLGLGRLADRGLKLVHFGQIGDEPGLEFGAELHEQPLDGTHEVLTRLRQHVHRGRLVFGRRRGRRLAQPLLGRPHRCAGADQVFSQGNRRHLPAGRRSPGVSRWCRDSWLDRQRGAGIRRRRSFAPTVPPARPAE